MNKMYYVSIEDSACDDINDYAIYSTFEKARLACFEHINEWYEKEENIKTIYQAGDEDYFTITVIPADEDDYSSLAYIIYPISVDEPIALSY